MKPKQPRARKKYCVEEAANISMQDIVTHGELGTRKPLSCVPIKTLKRFA